MRRVVSLFLPTWPTDRIRRRSGTPPLGEPLVTAATDGSRRVVAADGCGGACPRAEARADDRPRPGARAGASCPRGDAGGRRRRPDPAGAVVPALFPDRRARLPRRSLDRHCRRGSPLRRRGRRHRRSDRAAQAPRALRRSPPSPIHPARPGRWRAMAANRSSRRGGPSMRSRAFRSRRSASTGRSSTRCTASGSSGSANWRPCPARP